MVRINWHGKPRDYPSPVQKGRIARRTDLKTGWNVFAQYKFPRPDFVQRFPRSLWSAGSFPILGGEYKSFESIPFGNPWPKYVCIAQPRCRNQEGLDRIRRAAPTNCA